MVITFYTDSILGRMRSISHLEVTAIQDIEERYRVEAGTEKMDEIYRCIDDAVGKLRRRTIRWMKYDYTTECDNAKPIPVSYKFDFALSERRAVNKADALEEAMNSFLVEYALSEFYSHVSQGELSNKHSLQAIDIADSLDRLLYDKIPPIM